ncbi:MAG: aldehyde dehydrogenase family protein [Elusimicrobiota bacterium]|nr:aldehyde dehydrogenase family protein [Elusimicrobiota bacterium]
MSETLIPAPARDDAPEEIAAKAAQARRAAATWRRLNVSQRVAALRKAWRELAARREELARVIHEETGKPLAEAELMEIGTTGMLVSHFAANANRLFEDTPAPKPWFLLNKRAYARRVPWGVVGVVSPWNMPFLIPFADAFAAMLAGNAVLLKPSEWTTRTALWTESALAATGLFPEGLLTVARGGPAAGERVLDASDMVVFTGSTKAGREVAARAARDLKPCLLELGGKHPMIVLADAPLERAAAAAVWGGFSNAGQLCIGVERVFVEGPLFDKFVESVRRRMAVLRVSADGLGDMGRLTVPFQFDRVQAQLDDARAKGARVIGGEVLDRAGLLMAPALVLDPAPGMRVCSEEIFGPVLAVTRVGRAEEAVAAANEGPWGLAASVWTADHERGEALGAALQCGLVGVNEPSTHYALGSLPFGGFKSSGLGRRHGDEGLRAFTQPQSVIVHEWPPETADPWWFPYDAVKSAWLRRLTGL